MDTIKFPVLKTDSAGSKAGGTSVRATTADDPWAPYIMAQVAGEITTYDGVKDQQLQTGGLKVVTTISRSMEKKLYAAVSANLNSQSIRNTYQATVTALPVWALTGAELTDPKTGQIIAEYPGKGQSDKQCAIPHSNCQINTALSREQVGSSFKPYVLATAVTQGMNVKTSLLNANTELCVPPDTLSATLSKTVPYPSSSCSDAGYGYFPVSNDGGESIGDPKKGGGTTVQNALAQSSNTAFSDLAHRTTTSAIIKMAEAFGVNIKKYPNGSNLSQMVGQVGLALGTGSLSVNEQAQMLATIADGGMYHQAHLVKYWQRGAGAQQSPKPETHMVLTAEQAAQVQYAMEMTTIDGTAMQTVTYGQQTPGMVIGKTGTTTGSHSGFFIGSTTQYTLVVGMFTSSQDSNSNDNLAELGGGGFGGYWPAKIWNTFAESAFSTDPAMFPTAPAFTGDAWNQIGKLPAPTKTCTVNGKKVKVKGKACPKQDPPNKGCQYDPQNGQFDLCPGSGGQPTPTCSYDGQQNCTPTDGNGNPTPTPTCSYDGQQNCTPTDGGGGSGSPTQTPTCNPGDPACSTSTGGGNGGGNGGFGTQSGSPTVTGAAGGLALTAPPGLLLWAAGARRRRKHQRKAAE
jgi:membrane peptidoglycan carboxypeptidase